MNEGALLFIGAIALVLTAAPGVAAALLGVRFGVRDEPVLLCIGLAATGVTAMLTFWVYYLVPEAGGPCAYLVFFGSIAAILWCRPRLSGQRELLRRLAVPLGLWALATIFILFFGFLHGRIEDVVLPQYRFAIQPATYASDNLIPWFFSNWMFEGSPGSPPVFDPGWHFSERPPLQVAYVLTQRVFGWDEHLTRYEAIGVALQQLWVIGMWALLLAARVTRRTRALVMIAALVSDVAIANGFFVWPKLLAGAFVLASLALLIAPGESPLRRRPLTVVLLGALLGLAYLSHGTAVFGIIPIGLVALWRGLPNWRWLAAGAAAAIVLVVPWMAFQHYEDPPGNRLEKWTLAGAPGIDQRGVLEAIGDEYGEVGLGGALENKFDNFKTMVGGSPYVEPQPEGGQAFGGIFSETGEMVSDAVHWRLADAASKAREIKYWHLLWTLGLFVFALPVIAYGRLRGGWRDGPDWRFACFSLAFCGLASVIWGLLEFGNDAARAIVIVASLAVPLLGIAGAVAGLRATYPRLTNWFVGANVLTVLLVYIPIVTPEVIKGYSGFAAIAAAAGLAGFAKLAFSSAEP